MESETDATNRARNSKILAVLATLKYQSASPIGVAPITDSVSVTPTVAAKLIARSFIGHDIAISSSRWAGRRKVERPIRLRPVHSRAPDTPGASAGSSRDAIAVRTSRFRA